MKLKTINLKTCYDLFKKYGNLNLKVNTPYGFKKIKACDITEYNSDVIELILDNSLSIKGSPFHKVKTTGNKFIQLIKCTPGKKILTKNGFVPIKSIKKLDYKDDLYDIEVDEVQQYYSNGIVSHNSSIIQLISYILYGKSLETTQSKKFGDARFVNNKLPVDSCEGEMIIESSGEYYGIRRKTSIKKTSDGEVNKSTTVVDYFKLDSPTDEFNKEKMNEEDRIKTQKRINEIIGSYDNFIRIVLTTSDTLNSILSSNESVFIDSLLNDSGLNIFDLRLKAHKEYKDKIVKIGKVSCDVNNEIFEIEKETNLIVTSNETINQLNIQMLDVDERIKKGEIYKESVLKQLHNLDLPKDITSESDCISQIETHKKSILRLDTEKVDLTAKAMAFKETYDDARLTELLQEKEQHKEQQYTIKSSINAIKIEISNEQTTLYRFNSEIENLKKDGGRLKSDYSSLEHSKTCPVCEQTVSEKALEAIKIKLIDLANEMISIGEKIKTKETDKLPVQEKITSLEAKIVSLNEDYNNSVNDFQKNLEIIGSLQNDKQEVEKRELLMNQINVIPLKVENVNHKIKELEGVLNEYKRQIEKIKENEKINEHIETINNRLKDLKKEKEFKQKEINSNNNQISFYKNNIENREKLILKFKEQEKIERVNDIYQKCVHRDGIPTQILTTILLPKINDKLNQLLSNVDFNVWLDINDLKLKMCYTNFPNAIIDCISSSGKERTFSSICLKVALNEINAKSKPTMFMLDEVTGRLDSEESFDEFVDLLRVIKSMTKKLIIIEHNRDLSPDYLIHVKMENNLSNIQIE